jgi:tight adherence protein C
MSPVNVMVIAGGMVGFGGWLAYTGWVPTRPSLDVALGRLGQTPVAIDPERTDSVDVRLGRLARKVGIVERALGPMRPDLRLLHRSPEEQAAIIVTYTVLGVLFAPVVGTGAWLVGVRFPTAIPMWLSLAGGIGGAVLALRSIKPLATKRRRDFAMALSGFCDVCVMSLSSGRGVESSLEIAAQSGSGWPYVELQSALRSGYVRGETPWAALARLATEADLADLTELAAAISLAGDQGAAVRETLESKAKAIRERRTSDSERAAAATTERMGIPATLLLFGFVAFLGFPAISVLF